MQELSQNVYVQCIRQFWTQLETCGLVEEGDFPETKAVSTKTFCDYGFSNQESLLKEDTENFLANNMLGCGLEWRDFVQLTEFEKNKKTIFKYFRTLFLLAARCEGRDDEAFYIQVKDNTIKVESANFGVDVTSSKIYRLMNVVQKNIGQQDIDRFLGDIKRNAVFATQIADLIKNSMKKEGITQAELLGELLQMVQNVDRSKIRDLLPDQFRDLIDKFDIQQISSLLGMLKM